MVEDRDKAAIVRTIQSLAEVLGMKTTAEGVETADQARLLSALGCDFGQGFRSEEHTSELQSLMRNSYAVFCLKKKNQKTRDTIKSTRITHRRISKYESNNKVNRYINETY